MALDPENIRVYGDGEVWIAAHGTTLPTDLAGSLNASFLSLGYISEDGVQVNTEIETYEQGAWQAYAPVLYRRTKAVTRVVIPSLELSDPVIKAYEDGGTFASSGTGERVFTPPGGGDFEEWSIVLDVDDGNDTARYVFDRVILTAKDGMSFKKDMPTMSMMTFSVVAGADGAAGWRRYESRTVTS
jgi:hypothetical protein